MIRFYDVDKDYIKYLKQYDNRIPNVTYENKDKFVCGIVLHINSINYFAPISSNTNIVKTSLPIYNNDEIISSIRFSFMFPAKFDYLKIKDFNAIAKTDLGYANLLRIEYIYCKTHEKEIIEKAKQVYKIGCNKSHYLNSVCCDFKKLEEVYLNYAPVTAAKVNTTAN